jgi:hypothetical protein
MNREGAKRIRSPEREEASPARWNRDVHRRERLDILASKRPRLWLSAQPTCRGLLGSGMPLSQTPYPITTTTTRRNGELWKAENYQEFSARVRNSSSAELYRRVVGAGRSRRLAHFEHVGGGTEEVHSDRSTALIGGSLAVTLVQIDVDRVRLGSTPNEIEVLISSIGPPSSSERD